MMSDSKTITDHLLLGDQAVSRDTLFDRAARLAFALVDMGVGENDRVGILMRNDVPFVEIALAVNQIGGFAVPMNWHMTPPELKAVLDDCGARVVFCHDDLYPNLEPALDGQKVVPVPASEPVRAAYRIDQPLSETAHHTYASLLASPPWKGQPPALRSNIIYTSGTTGQPKGVVREPAKGEMIERVQAVMEWSYGLGRDTLIRTVITGPMYHSVPNVYALTAVRRPGSMVILQPRFDAEELLQLIEAYAITHLHLVPTMFVRLLKLPGETRRRYDLTSLRFVAHGAAPCPPEVKRRMIEWWGPVIHEYYGASETGPAVAHGSEEALAKPGTAGKALPWSHVRVLDEQGAPVPAGTIGEVFVRIDGYPQSVYLNNEELSARNKKEGLTSAGDLGYLDDDGYLFLTGRASDMIVSGGVNIYPSEIEAAIQELDGVRDSAVFGVPDSEFGEIVCAYVQNDEGVTLDPETLRDGLAGGIARYKIPKVIKIVDDLPREDSGKLRKKRLKSAYLEGRSVSG